ncbi:MAG: dihydrofolate reductase [Planctomycetota bacterium]
MSEGNSTARSIEIVLVVAASENNTIGVDGGLPWSLPDDLKHFKRTTIGRPVIMGRKTFDEIGRKPLPGRPNLVISGTLEPSDIEHDAVSVHRSLTNALDHAGMLIDPGTPAEICIIGGGQIYRQALAIANTIVLTRVHAQVRGDTTFPEIPRHIWTLDRAEHHDADDRHAHAFTFEWWSRK